MNAHLFSEPIYSSKADLFDECASIRRNPIYTMNVHKLWKCLSTWQKPIYATNVYLFGECLPAGSLSIRRMPFYSLKTHLCDEYVHLFGDVHTTSWGSNPNHLLPLSRQDKVVVASCCVIQMSAQKIKGFSHTNLLVYGMSLPLLRDTLQVILQKNLSFDKEVRNSKSN